MFRGRSGARRGGCVHMLHHICLRGGGVGGDGCIHDLCGNTYTSCIYDTNMATHGYTYMSHTYMSHTQHTHTTHTHTTQNTSIHGTSLFMTRFVLHSGCPCIVTFSITPITRSHVSSHCARLSITASQIVNHGLGVVNPLEETGTGGKRDHLPGGCWG